MKRSILILMVLLFLLAISCSPAYQPPQAPSVTTTTVTTTTVVPLSTTTPLSTTQSGPVYNVVSFTINNDEDEYTFPVYLKNEETLHLTWFVKQGDRVWFHILTPSGKSMGFYENGYFANGTLEDGYCQGFTEGITIFSPSDYGWGEGYYEMMLTTISDSPSSGEVNYWINDNAN